MEEMQSTQVFAFVMSTDYIEVQIKRGKNEQ